MRKSVENLRGRKLTGGKIIPATSRRKYEIDRYPSEPVLGKSLTVQRRVRGGNKKISFKKVEYANVSDSVEKKSSKVKILKVAKNPANKDFERRGVLTKGAIIDCELGQARIVSRPGQDGIINAVLIKH